MPYMVCVRTAVRAHTPTHTLSRSGPPTGIWIKREAVFLFHTQGRAISPFLFGCLCGAGGVASGLNKPSVLSCGWRFRIARLVSSRFCGKKPVFRFPFGVFFPGGLCPVRPIYFLGFPPRFARSPSRFCEADRSLTLMSEYCLYGGTSYPIIYCGQMGLFLGNNPRTFFHGDWLQTKNTTVG